MCVVSCLEVHVDVFILNYIEILDVEVYKGSCINFAQKLRGKKLPKQA